MTVEGDRRRLLRVTDDLLEGIEQLRLRHLITVPERLQTQIAGVAAEIGESPRDWTPTTVADAHDQVFRLQRLLLRGGGGQRPRRTHPTTAAAATIPDLVIPPRRRSDTEREWQERVRLVVQRAHDRVLLLDDQAQAVQGGAGAADEALAAKRSAQADVARQSFERLVRHAERVTDRPVSLDAVPSMPTRGRLQAQDVVVDLDAGRVHQAGRAVHLTRQELRCLVALAANPDRVLTREAMQHLVTGNDPMPDVRSRALDVHLAHLRAKLGQPPYLETVPGVGFQMTVRPAPLATQTAAAGGTRERRRVERRAWARGSSASPPASAPTQGGARDRRPGR